MGSSKGTLVCNWEVLQYDSKCYAKRRLLTAALQNEEYIERGGLITCCYIAYKEPLYTATVAERYHAAPLLRVSW